MKSNMFKNQQPIDVEVINVTVQPPEVKPTKTFTPFGDLIAVYLLPQEKTASGLVLPQSAARDSYETAVCEVIAVGPDCKTLKVGDMILVNPQPIHVAVQHKRQRTIMMKESHALGIVD